MGIYCPYCGSIIHEGSLFCKFCGKKLEGQSPRRVADELAEKKAASLRSELESAKLLRDDAKRRLDEKESSYSMLKLVVFTLGAVALIVFIVNLILFKSSGISTEKILTLALSFAIGAGCFIGFFMVKGSWDRSLRALKSETADIESRIEETEAALSSYAQKKGAEE